VSFHVGLPASEFADERLPYLDLLEGAPPVLLVPFGPVAFSVCRPPLVSVVVSTGWLQAQLEPGQLSVGESSPG
jgi:hypothetical protein